MRDTNGAMSDLLIIGLFVLFCIGSCGYRYVERESCAAPVWEDKGEMACFYEFGIHRCKPVMTWRCAEWKR